MGWSRQSSTNRRSGFDPVGGYLQLWCVPAAWDGGSAIKLNGHAAVGITAEQRRRYLIRRWLNCLRLRFFDVRLGCRISSMCGVMLTTIATVHAVLAGSADLGAGTFV